MNAAARGRLIAAVCGCVIAAACSQDPAPERQPVPNATPSETESSETVQQPVVEKPVASRRAEEFRQRLIDVNWKDVGAWKPEDLIAGMRLYIDSEDPVWPLDDRHYRDMTIFLRRERPDPNALRPLLGPHKGESKVDSHLLKRDKVACAVLHSYMGRIWRKDKEAAQLWDNLLYAAVHFAFEPVYGASHPGAAASLSEFFSDPQVSASDESAAAIRAYLDPLLKKWRARVTRKASSTFFGTLLRHLGPSAADVLYPEWEEMDANERVDLLRRTEGMDELGRIGRGKAVEALLDDSMEVREAAFDLLRALKAPLGKLDASSRDAAIENAQPALQRWVAETKS